MVTGDTNGTTVGELLRRGDIGDFPKSVSPSVTCHILAWLILL
jgi:hypothetical protein